jgi:hypothetical protein
MQRFKSNARAAAIVSPWAIVRSGRNRVRDSVARRELVVVKTLGRIHRETFHSA